MINYEKLLIELQARGLSGKDLVDGAGLSSATAAKIAKDEKVSKKKKKKIADYLKCDTETLYSPDQHNKILSILREEKESRISGGLYHELQIRIRSKNFGRAIS